nr:hypothetical protein [Haliea sp.]
MLNDIGRFLHIEHEVDRHQHGTDRAYGEARYSKGIRISRQDGDTVTGLNSTFNQPASNAQAEVVKLGIIPVYVVLPNGGLLRVSGRGAP